MELEHTKGIITSIEYSQYLLPLFKGQINDDDDDDDDDDEKSHLYCQVFATNREILKYKFPAKVTCTLPIVL